MRPRRVRRKKPNGVRRVASLALLAGVAMVVQRSGSARTISPRVPAATTSCSDDEYEESVNADAHFGRKSKSIKSYQSEPQLQDAALEWR